MKRAGMNEENSLRNGVVWILDVLTDYVLYLKWYRPILKENDPKKRLEKELLLELLGVRLGGMAVSGAYKSFKPDYYDKLDTDTARIEVRKTLFRMLRSGHYKVSEKEMIASVCSDLRMDEAAKDIAFVREAAARNMSMRQLFRFKREKVREMRKHNLA